MSPRDYHFEKPLPLHLNVTSDNVAYYVRRSLASYLCTHDPEIAEMNRPCRNCLVTIEPLVMPVAKALTWTITEARISVGAAVEVLIRDADFELSQFRRTAMVPKPQEKASQPVPEAVPDGF